MTMPGHNLQALREFLLRVLEEFDRDYYMVSFDDHLDQIEVASSQPYPSFIISDTGEVTFHAKYMQRENKIPYVGGQT